MEPSNIKRGLCRHFVLLLTRESCASSQRQEDGFIQLILFFLSYLQRNWTFLTGCVLPQSAEPASHLFDLFGI